MNEEAVAHAGPQCQDTHTQLNAHTTQQFSLYYSNMFWHYFANFREFLHQVSKLAQICYIIFVISAYIAFHSANGIYIVRNTVQQYYVYIVLF